MKPFRKGTSKKMAHLFSVAVAGAILSSPIVAQATIIDWSNSNAGQIESYNTATSSNTVLDANAPGPGNLISVNNGNSIIYASNLNSGSNLYIYNIQTKTNTILASGSSLSNLNNSISSIALTPSGQSVLVSGGGDVGNVDKVNISTGAVSLFMSGGTSVLSTTLADPSGIAFTPSGNLFLNFAGGIDQINYQSGTVSKTNSTYGFLTSLTYDPTTKYLYATPSITLGNSPQDAIIQIDPTTLSENLITLSGTGLTTQFGFAGIGATSNGNLIIGDYLNTQNLLEYFTTTNTTISLAQAQGISSLMIEGGSVGGGSNLTGTPEPGTFALFGTGILAMVLFSLYSRRKAESC